MKCSRLNVKTICCYKSIKAYSVWTGSSIKIMWNLKIAGSQQYSIIWLFLCFVVFEINNLSLFWSKLKVNCTLIAVLHLNGPCKAFFDEPIVQTYKFNTSPSIDLNSTLCRKSIPRWVLPGTWPPSPSGDWEMSNIEYTGYRWLES